MSHIAVGVLALIVGAVFCLRGSLALRAVIAIWGAFVGFGLGSALVAWFTGQPPLSGVAGWVGAVIGAVLFGALAYALYAAAVILTMGSVGYGIGSAVASGFAIPGWCVIAAGVVGAVVLAIIGLVTNMPAVLLIVVSAIGGAAAMVAGIALLVGVVSLPGGDTDTWVADVTAHWWLDVAFVVLAILGIVIQWRHLKTDLRTSYRRST